MSEIKRETSIIIEKVAYGVTIGDLKFGNVRPGVVEATLKPGATLEDALDELDDRLIAWHKKRYPHLYSANEGRPTVEELSYVRGLLEPLPTISKDFEKLEIAIDNAETVDELKDVKTVYPLMPEIMIDMYNKKMEQLLSGRPANFTENLDQ